MNIHIFNCSCSLGTSHFAESFAFQNSDIDKAKKLLELLPLSRKENVFISFVNALQESYEWLAEKLLNAHKASSNGNQPNPDTVKFYLF